MIVYQSFIGLNYETTHFSLLQALLDCLKGFENKNNNNDGKTKHTQGDESVLSLKVGGNDTNSTYTNIVIISILYVQLHLMVVQTDPS